MTMLIEVCGKGCPRCHATKDNAIQALKELNLKEGEDVALTHIQDPKLMAARGVIMTPAVLIDGVKVAEGRIPSTGEIKKWIEEKMG